MGEQPRAAAAQDEHRSSEDPSEELAQGQPPPGRDRALPQKHQHHCTDLPCLVFFLVNAAIFSYIAYVAVSEGNLFKLVRGCNAQRQICGVDTPEAFLVWPRDPETMDILAKHPMCVSACPTNSNTTHVVDLGRGPQELADTATVQAGHLCLPAPGDSVSHEEAEREIRDFVNKIMERPIIDAVAALHLYEDVRDHSNVLFPVVVVVGTISGYVFLYLLGFCAECLAYMVMFGILASAFGGGASFVWYNKCQTDIELGLVLIFFGCLLLPCFNTMRSQLNTAVGCIEASTECLFQEPTLLAEPFLSVIIRIVLVTGCLAHFGLLVTSVPMQCVGAYGLRKLPLMTPWHDVAAVYSIFIYFWAIEIHHIAAHYVIVWTTQHWYFAPYVGGLKQHVRRCNIGGAFLNMLRYHLGTVAMGALLIVYTRPLRMFLKLVLGMANMDNPVANLIAACFSHCEGLYQRIAHVKKEAFMDVAVHSSPFLEAGWRSADLLDFEDRAVASLNGTQFIFKVCCVALVGMSSYWAVVITFGLGQRVDSDGFEAKNSMRLGLLSGGFGCLIGVCFMHVFDAVGDTILYCYALEHRRKDLQAQAQALVDPPQSSWWGYLFGEEETSSEEEPEYVPKALHTALRKYGSG